MKIIFCGLKNENYNSARGTSFEYNNFYLTLKNLPNVEVIDYFFDRILEVGKKKYNEELLALVEKEKPDLVFVFMYTDEVDGETLTKIKKDPRVLTLGWFSDDHWRLDNYSRFYAPYFDWVVTTYSKGPEKYARYGIYNVIRSQWGCNTALWRPNFEVKRDIDVSFVGQWNPMRGKIVSALRKTGINIFVRGFGWLEGKASQQEMIEIFSRSKINLNLNAAIPFWHPKRLARFFLKKSVGQLVLDFHLISNIKSWLGMSIPQIKARPFEILGCRTFLISPKADDMENYYEDGREIVYYNGIADLISKINYYLQHPDEREIIAEAGYQRTITNHTYAKRFEEIFNKLN
jgi:spore maturation protein CgeB